MDPFVYDYRCDSPLGDLILVSDGDALTGLWFADQKDAPTVTDRKTDANAPPVFHETRRWLDLYFSGKDPAFTPKLRLFGTPFRKTVWELLLTIPYGRTASYGGLAKALARKIGIDRMSAQAVGGAVGKNPISLLVPCHRVIGADGNLTGYAGGLQRKAALLALEHADLTADFLPSASYESEGSK